MVITGRKNANGNGSGNRSQEPIDGGKRVRLVEPGCVSAVGDGASMEEHGHLDQGGPALRKRVPMMATTIKPTVKRNARS